MALDYIGNVEIVREARRRLHQGAWEYLVGASESETTMRRNRLAFDRIAFRPRVLVNVSEIDTSTTFLGQQLRIPVMLAPIGSLQEFSPGGAVDATRAAAEYGIMHVVSSATEPSLEETAKAIDYPKMFQLYIRGDWGWVQERIERVKAAGYVGFCLTVDTAVISRRERPMIGRWQPPTQRPGAVDRTFQAAVTWDMMDKIKASVGLPFMLKGIATAEDAKIAIDHGVDVIWVSNHGGRQLDHGRGTMDILPEIVDAVQGRAEIVLDGGVQRGTDVLKAVALGARAVAIGKLQGWGLAAAGPAGLVRVLEILEAEIRTAMGLIGVTSMGQLNGNYVCPAEPVMWPHEMSAFGNLLEGQIR